MKDLAPTLDRLFLGLLSGSGVAALSLSFAVVFAQGFDMRVWPVLALVAFLILALFVMPIVFTPLWLGASALGLPHWLGAVMAGAVTLIAAPMLITFLLGFQHSYEPAPDVVAYITVTGLVGAVSGLAAWRVAHWSVDLA